MYEPYTITSYFSTRVDLISREIKTYSGSNIVVPSGTPVFMVADSTVVGISYDADGFGFYVKQNHDDTYSRFYGLCSALLASADRQTIK